MVSNIPSSSYSNSKEEKAKRPTTPNDFYNNFKLIKGSIDDYTVQTKIGRGRYSEVFEGKNIKSNNLVIVKILKPIVKAKIKREVKILSDLRGGPNIIQLIDVLKDRGTKIFCLVYDSGNTVDMKKIAHNITEEDLRLYMHQLLTGLDYCHSKGIMHRDIKPGNVVVNTLTKELSIIDWGLAEYYIKDYEYNVRVSSRYYKSPELLLNFKRYDYAIDMWSLGCLFAGIIFRMEYFFKGTDINNQIVKIASVLGAQDINDYMHKYPRSNSLLLSTMQKHTKITLDSFINEDNKHLATPEALDLLGKLLIIDQADRITASKALLHPYFNKLTIKK